MIVFISTGIILIFFMLLAFYRVIKGPTAMDRLLGVNVIGTKATVILIIMGIIFERVDMFVDIAIGYAMLNFIASIAAAKYFQHHKAVSPESEWAQDTQEGTVN